MAAIRPQRRIGRLSEIGRVATRHGFGYLIDRRRSNDDTHYADRGRRIREMLDELGPTFVKFGQLLSTRPDVMPPDIIVELRKLQDDVTPIPFSDIRRVIEEEMGLTLEQAFLTFDETPIAAASIGQVHRATLPTGDQVVVKVQRPEAPRQVESDLQLMRSAARSDAARASTSSSEPMRAYSRGAVFAVGANSGASVRKPSDENRA